MGHASQTTPRESHLAASSQTILHLIQKHQDDGLESQQNIGDADWSMGLQFMSTCSPIIPPILFSALFSEES